MGAGVKFVILLRLFLEVGKSCFFIPIWWEAASLTPGVTDKINGKLLIYGIN